MGRALYHQNDLSGAIEQYKKAIQFNPDDAAVLQSLGWVYLLQHKFGEAEKALLKSWKIWEESSQYPAVNLGHITLFRNDHKKAISWYQKSLVLCEDKAKFFRGMDSDFMDLRMEELGISRSEYDSILEQLKIEGDLL